jgi:hypothetical protein
MKYILFKISSIIFLLLFISTALAEDVYIHHQNYGNTHSKWKNRLEAASHTVTSSTNIATNFSGIEQYYDLRYSSNSLPTDGLKTILSNGGTVVLNGENTNFGTRNGQIQTFIRDVTSDNSITYSTSLNIDYTGTNEQLSTTTVLTSLPNNWSYLNFAFGGVISNLGTNGKCLAANGQGRCGVALFDGDALDSSYSGGKVIIITDINYASHSQYYTNDNKEFLNALISDITTSTVNTRLATLSGITSSQTTEFNTYRNKSVNGNQIYITQTGDNNVLNILQDGDDNLVIGTDLTSAGVINGDNNNVDIDQIGTDNVLGLDIVGSSNDVDVIQNQDQRAKLNITGSSNTANLNQSAINDVGEHYMSVIIAGSNNTLDLDQTETGNKKLFLDIDGTNNVTVDQKGTGNHYAEITLTDSHTVDVTQDGSGDHNATINLSGNSTTINLTQDSSTSQNYYIQQNCVTAGGCGTTTVTQN